MTLIEEFLWRASLEGGAALLVVFLICRVATGIPANVKCWLWRLAWLRVVLAVFSWRLIEAPILPARDIPMTEVVVESGTPSGVLGKSATEPVVALAGSLNHRLPSWKPSGLQILVAVWVLGAAVAVGRIGFQFCAARRLREGSIPTEEFGEELEAASKELEIKNPALLISERTQRPVLVGVFSPAIILPPGVRNGVDLILRHELAHLKRRDLVWNWLTAVGSALLWFHPLAWLGVRETNLAQEMACDELALGRDRSKARDLANLLIDLASDKESVPPASISAVGIIQTKKNLERRIKAMNVQRRNGWWVVAALVMAAPAIVPWRVVAQKAEAVTGKEKSGGPAEEQKFKSLTAEERSALDEKLKRAKEEKDAALEAVKNRKSSWTEANEKARVYYRLYREVAFADKDLDMVKHALKQEIDLTRRLRDEAESRITLGVETPAMRDKCNAELRELKKQLAKYGPDWSRNTLYVTVHKEGVISKVLVKRGDYVTRDQPILQLDDREARIKLRTAEAELEIAKADSKLQTMDVQKKVDQYKEMREKNKGLAIEEERDKERLELQLRRAQAQLVIAEQKVEQARLELEPYVIKAPSNGVIAHVPGVGYRMLANAANIGYLPDEAE